MLSSMDVNLLKKISWVENLNSRELDRLSIGILALRIPIPKKITVGIV